MSLVPCDFNPGLCGRIAEAGLGGPGLKSEDLGGFPKLGVPFGGPNDKDYSILGSILGSPYFGKLPFKLQTDVLA